MIWPSVNRQTPSRQNEDQLLLTQTGEQKNQRTPNKLSTYGVFESHTTRLAAGRAAKSR